MTTRSEVRRGFLNPPNALIWQLPARRRVLRRLGLLSLSSALFAVSACTVNPVSGRPSVVLTTPEQERQLGRKVASQLDYYVGLTKTAPTTEYVAAVGARLAAWAPGNDFDYRFQVLESVEPNAMALPGGYIYVTRGLLPLLNSEAELANVLSHEIIHVAARHSGQTIARAAPLSLVTGIGAMAGSIVSPAIGRAVAGAGSAAGGIVLAPYSRENEKEADAQGQRLAAAAGYDPAAMSSFLKTLQRDDMLRSESAGAAAGRRSWFSSHPSTPQRARVTGERAGTIEFSAREPIAADRESFLARLDGLTIGQNAAEGVFIDRLFLQPDMNFAIRFPDLWITHNARHMLAAQSKDGAATIILEGVAEGDDPLVAAHAFEEASRIYLDKGAQRRRVGRLEAATGTADIEVEGKRATASLTWIAYNGIIFRVTGICGRDEFASYRKLFETTAGTFRSLTPDERAGIRQVRLRVREGRGGETLADFVSRTSSDWTAAQVAVFNALAPDATLAAGQRLKVAISEPY